MHHWSSAKQMTAAGVCLYRHYFFMRVNFVRFCWVIFDIRGISVSVSARLVFVCVTASVCWKCYMSSLCCWSLEPGSCLEWSLWQLWQHETAHYSAIAWGRRKVISVGGEVRVGWNDPNRSAKSCPPRDSWTEKRRLFTHPRLPVPGLC